MSEHGAELVLVRHGQTEWSESGQHTGRTDIPLTPIGESQAVAAGRLLAGSHFDLILVSPLSRARKTAVLAGLTPFETTSDLREWDYGDFEGLTSEEIHETHPGWTVWDGPWPGGEHPSEVEARCDRVVKSVLALGPDKTAAVVAHGHILRALAARWLGLEVGFGRYLALDTATVSRMGWEHDCRVITRWNEVPA